MHLEEARDTFLLLGARVVDVGTSLQLTSVDAEEAETTYVGVGSDLKRQSRQRRAGVYLTNDFLFGVVGVGTDDLRSIHWAGQVSCDSVKEGLYALVLEGRAAEHGADLHSERTLTDSSTDLIFGDRRRIFEVLFHQDVIAVSERFEHLVAPFFGFSLQFGGDVDDVVVSTHRLIIPYKSLHRDEVDDTAEGFFLPYRDLDGARGSTEDGLDLTYYFEEVSTGAVHLVDVAHARYAVLVRLTPYSLTLRLYTTDSTEGSHSTVKDTERTLYFDREVNVSWGVNEVDLVLGVVVVPEGSRSSGGNRDTTLLLLLHPVHRSTTIVYFTDLVGQPCVEEDTLRRSRLTGIDVGHDTDISREL